eukprot:TRINITY_DN9815_c0_g1_i3.p1 TRINITY_DN9815_c0_g1~~TRINITY_DN9815_c0_g1_i3.p1  ORF type:complete len:203 (+),score=-12.91 TRINITY_DN9815_c0_g1_i3:477-1085(+)
MILLYQETSSCNACAQSFLIYFLAVLIHFETLTAVKLEILNQNKQQGRLGRLFQRGKLRHQKTTKLHTNFCSNLTFQLKIMLSLLFQMNSLRITVLCLRLMSNFSSIFGARLSRFFTEVSQFNKLFKYIDVLRYPTFQSYLQQYNSLILIDHSFALNTDKYQIFIKVLVFKIICVSVLLYGYIYTLDIDSFSQYVFTQYEAC